MATLYNLGRSSGLWNTMLRTDCTGHHQEPLKWVGENLDAYDAVFSSPIGDLDMGRLAKGGSPSFVRDDGKGFIGIHQRGHHLHGLAEYGQMLGGYFDGHPWGQFNGATRGGRRAVFPD